jgi:hypothetical protein
MTLDQAEYTWESTPYSDAGVARSAGRRGAWRGLVAALRLTAFLLIATLAILVLFPAAIAAQAAFVV